MAAVEHLPEIARRLGEALAERLRDEPVVRALWVLDSPGRLDFWIVTDEIDFDADWELRAKGHFLYDLAPDVDILIHTVNSLWYGVSDPALVIPDEATPIALHAA